MTASLAADNYDFRVLSNVNKREIETLVVLVDLSQEKSETSFDCHHLVLHLAASTVQLMNQFSGCNGEQPGIEKLEIYF